MNGQNQQPTKQQMEHAAKEIAASLELMTKTYELKRQKRKSIVLAARADIGLIDIELDMMEAQIDMTKKAQAQNNENMTKGGSSIIKPFGAIPGGLIR
jgi:hypothetical protein